MNPIRALPENKPLKVVFFLPNLGGGGAERVMLNILRHIDRDRFEPVLYLFEKDGALLPLVPAGTSMHSFEDLRVPEIFGFKMAGLIWRFARHLKRLRPHVLLSFMWYPNAIAIIAGRLADSRLKVAVSERTSTSVYSRKADSIFRSAIIRFLYPRADIVISPSEAIAQDLISRGNRSDKLAVIQNPVDLTMVRELACAALDHPWYRADEDVIIAIGRLGSEKGFHYLVRAIALLRKEEVACKLLILGEGQERKTLEELIARLGLQECVELAGFQQNPYKYLIRSRIFVLSSLYEGFPNVLLEALALGIPSVATRCLTGPEEIISDGVNGILVPPADERMLADAVRRLLQDEDLRGRLGEEGKKRAEDFGVEKIVRRFEGLIESLSAEPVKK